MYQEIMRKISFKYFIWSCLGATAIYIGFWSGRFEQLGLSSSLMEFNINNILKVAFSCWIFIFHLVFTFLACKNNKVVKRYKKSYDDSLDEIGNLNKSLGITNNYEENIAKYLVARSESRIVTSYGSVGEMREAVEVLKGERQDSDFIIVDESVSEDEKLGGIALLNIAIMDETDGGRESYDRTYEAYEKSRIAHEDSVNYTKTQMIIGFIIGIIFIIGVIVWIVNMNWITLGSIFGGIFLGYLLSATEEMKGLDDRSYFPYLVLILVGIYGFCRGYFIFSGFEYGTAKMKDGGEYTGRVLYMDKENIAIRIKDYTVYLKAENIQSVSLLNVDKENE